METPMRRPSEGAMIGRPGDVAFMPNPRLVPDDAIGVHAASTV